MPASALPLLVQISLLQAWRRLKAVREQSRLLLALITAFISSYAILSFWLFYRGLKFIETFPGLGAVLTDRLMYLLFAFLFLLLLFSNVVIGYTNFFRNRESHFLLSLPVDAVTVFRWKFIESALLASWAFLFLIAPLLAAYGLTRSVPWHFYAATVGLIFLFIILPGIAGSWVAVALARFMDRRLLQILMLLGAVGAIAGAAIWLKPEPISDEMLETRVLVVLDRLLDKTRFAQFPFLPSYWLSAGVLNWAEGALTSAGFFSLVLFSHVLFFGFMAWTGMGGAFYDGFSQVQSRGSVLARWRWFQRLSKRKATVSIPTSWGERLLRAAAFWAPADVRALILKDARVFWRDTTQWGQTLVLFGLLGVYIINLRHFSRQLTNPFWVNLVSFLNLGACSLNLATLTTRFVYPQFSLEGKRLWIIGMAPLGLGRVVRIKFTLASVASLTVTLGLIWFSCQMLQMTPERTLFFAAAVAFMTFTLNGLAMGLGVLYPNFKEDNPSKIVSGFGGTFCLILSFVYIAGSVALLALGASLSAHEGNSLGLAIWMGFTVFSILVGGVPMFLAIRRLPTFEF